MPDIVIDNPIGQPISKIFQDIGKGRGIGMSYTAALQSSSLARCIIYPCKLMIGDSAKNFYLEPVWGDSNSLTVETYLGLLGFHGVGFNSPRRGLEVCFYHDAPIVETASNNYGDTFIANYLKMFTGEGMSDLGQMAGVTDVNGLVDEILGSLGTVGNVLSTGKQAVSDFLTSTAAQTATLKGKAAGLINSGVNAANKALMGQRFDFPSVWKSSGFNATYSLTVRLVNPDPQNKDMTDRYITGPLCALLCLGLPIGQGASYSWPFVHMIESPGMFISKAAAVQNITVTKGGDQNLHTIYGIPQMIDVRIDFINLYEPMLAGNTSELHYRTNLKDYMDNISKENWMLDEVSSTTSTVTESGVTVEETGTSILEQNRQRKPSTTASSTASKPTLTGGTTDTRSTTKAPIPVLEDQQAYWMNLVGR